MTAHRVAKRGTCLLHTGVFGLCVLMVLATAPLLFGSMGHTVLSQMGIAIIGCLSFNLLLGQGGMPSLGHAVYFGAGAFAAIHALNAIPPGLPVPVGLLPLAGGVASFALALPLGWVCTRYTHMPFAMITLAIGELLCTMAQILPDFLGGEGGIMGNRVTRWQPFGISYAPQIQLYYLIAAYTVVCTALMLALTATPLGLMLRAVRDNPERCDFLGYSSHRVRYQAFVIAAFFAGIAGGLAALQFEIVTADMFGSSRSFAYLVFTLLGGTGFFAGPILGGILMVLAEVWLSAHTPAWQLYLGIVFLAMVLYAPGGLASIAVRHLRPAYRQGPRHADGADNADR